MSYVAMGSTIVTGGVAGENILEGLLVQLSASGLHEELPTVVIASSGATNVYCCIVPPDFFPRPTPQGMFNRTVYGQLDARNASEFLVDSGQRGVHYLISPSMLVSPTALSGWMVQLHKGGAYTLQSSCFVDSAQIRVPGAPITVAAGGKAAYGTSAIVGHVREYRDGRLTIVLDPRSS